MRCSVNKSVLWSNKFEKCCQLYFSFGYLQVTLVHQKYWEINKECILTLSAKCFQNSLNLFDLGPYPPFPYRQYITSFRTKVQVKPWLQVKHDFSFLQEVLCEMHIAFSASHSRWPQNSFSSIISLFMPCTSPMAQENGVHSDFILGFYIGPSAVPLT